MNKGHNPASGRLQSSKGGIACPGGTVVKNLPANARDVDLILDWKDPWRRKRQPTPGFLPGKFHGQRRLEGYSPWSCKESDTAE